MSDHKTFSVKKFGSIAVIAALISSVFLLTNSASASLSSSPGSFVAVSPYRIIDTRPSKVGNGYGGGSPFVFTVTGNGGVPYSGVTAVSLNVTVTGTEAPDYGGYVTVYPCGSRPDASSLNFSNGQTVANAVISPVNEYGQVCFYVFGRAQLLVDVNGYYQVASGGGPDFYNEETGLLYMDANSYDYWYLYCPTGTVAISGNESVMGWPSVVKLWDDYALIYITNDSSYSTDSAFGQLTCSTYSTSASSTSTQSHKDDSQNQLNSNELASRQALLDDLISQSIEAGFTRNGEPAK